MSKRKNRSASSPNLPQEALERARRQIAEERGDLAEPAPTPEPKVEEKPKPAVQARPASMAPYRPVTETRSTRITPTTVSAGRVSKRRANEPGQGKRRDDSEPFDMKLVRYMLLHPTKTVSREELTEQYHYVIRDLRQIAMLSAGLIIALVALALVLPK